MFRLIDADALKQECVYIDDIPVVTERDINDAPTVDAIPMKWLEKKLHEGYHRACTKAVLDMWQKEQEAR